MFHLFKRKKISSTECVDIIEGIVYEHLKPLGFRKHGRTLHRFVEKDISQVINFQNGCPQKGVYDILWINIGIRVPECAEKKFVISEPMKKYYHEYECNIRTRLGSLVDGEDTFYDLGKRPKRIAADIIDRIKKYVIPVFDVLNSREAILLYRANYPSFDQFANHIILLEEAMIYGRSGDIEKASELFNKHYQNALVEYKADFENGIQTYLRKGERLVYRNTKTGETETIIADKDGYVITYSANRGHIDYLETLASELGIVLKQYKNIDDLISDAKAQSKKNEAKKNMTESDEGCTPGGRDEPPRYIPDKER